MRGYDLCSASRKACTGMCALAMKGDEDSANRLYRMYLSEAIQVGYTTEQALSMLAKSAMGMAMSAAAGSGAGPAWFDTVGLGLAARS